MIVDNAAGILNSLLIPMIHSNDIQFFPVIAPSHGMRAQVPALLTLLRWHVIHVHVCPEVSYNDDAVPVVPIDGVPFFEEGNTATIGWEDGMRGSALIFFHAYNWVAGDEMQRKIGPVASHRNSDRVKRYWRRVHLCDPTGSYAGSLRATSTPLIGYELRTKAQTEGLHCRCSARFEKPALDWVATRKAMTVVIDFEAISTRQHCKNR